MPMVKGDRTMSNTPLYRPRGWRVLAAAAALAALSVVHVAARQDPPPPAAVFKPGADVTLPRLIYDPRPNYTSDAMRNQIAGRVVMEIVVEPDGNVGAVRVTQSLDAVYGLDDEAVRTVKKWRFVPGMKDGVAVRVMVEVEMTFTLRGRDGAFVDPKPGTPVPNPAMAWPETFLPTDSAVQGPWTEVTVDAAGVHIRAAYPQGWTVHRRDTAPHVVAFMNENGMVSMTIAVAEGVSRLPTAALSVQQLDAFFSGMKSRASLVETAGVGQVRSQERVWLWHQAYVPRADFSSAPPEVQAVAQAKVGSVTIWTFVTALPSQGLSVTCTVTHPPGIADTAVAEQQRHAGAIFGELVRRISITPK